MTQSYLDTTLVAALAENSVAARRPAENLVAANGPASYASYALRELLAGPIQVLCNVHNRLVGAADAGEVLVSLASLHPVVGRKKGAAIQAFAESFSAAMRANPGLPRSGLAKEMQLELALQVSRMWRRARRLKSVTQIQPLACFNVGDIQYGDSGELWSSNDSFNCVKSQRCAAAAYIYDDQPALAKMCDALHPNRLPEKLAEKRETKSRRKALVELRNVGPLRFNKIRCRALGDAYFAAMCPKTHVIATTNNEDFEPLCDALAKKVISP